MTNRTTQSAKSWHFLNSNKIDKPLSNLIKRERQDPNQQIRDEMGDITTDSDEIQRTIEEYFETFIIKTEET